jgi:hypothetical protein
LKGERIVRKCLLLGLAAVALASADPIKVAILGSPNGGAAWNADVQSKLLATGDFSAVDVYDISTTTPTLAQLESYSAVLVYSDGAGYADATTLGNNLADYVDAGGGVVTAVFADASIPFGGRFATDDYWAIEPAGQSSGTDLQLGTIHQPGSPLLAGVTSFDGGSSSYYGTGALQASATDVADWSNGAPLIAERTIGGTARVDLNFFPPSSDVRSDFWTSSTDGALLMANALDYTAGVTAVPEPSAIALFGTCLLFTALAIRKRRSNAGARG